MEPPEEFICPPEAPVFQPTWEEFKDPIAFITKIRPVAVNTGICKIRPPAGWKPPFSVNRDSFRFTPRLQPLNELEAKTRVKLNFLESLAKFWELQGISFKIPNVERRPLDLHRLFKVVTQLGGFEEVCRQRRWSLLAKELGCSSPNVSSTIRANYEKYLYPYELFLAKTAGLELTPQHSTAHRSCSVRMGACREQCGPAQLDTTPKPCKYGLRQNKRRDSSWEDPDYVVDMDEANPEFKKLAFTSPGPKNAFAPLKRQLFKGGGSRKLLPGEHGEHTVINTNAAEVKSEPDFPDRKSVV